MFRVTCDRGSDMLGALLGGAHLAVPDDLPTLLMEHGRRLEASETVLFLVDYDQRVLVPLRNPDGPARDELAIDGTVAGRSFRSLDIQHGATAEKTQRIWVPVIDGTERLGVLEFAIEADVAGDVDERFEDELRAFAGLVAELVVTKNAYGDFLELTRRREPMSIAAELAWNLLPPLTFGCDQAVISGAVVPTYDLGGDSFDYGVDARTARFAVFDAMGHGLEAGLLATVAVAAYRNSRRRGLDLYGCVVSIDEAIRGQFGPDRFVTAVLAELDLASGQLRWCLAGHPPPLLLRRGKIVKTLESDVGLPLGLGVHAAAATEALEPGDKVVLYTDGVVEARSADGEFFGIDRLVDLIGRAEVAQNPPPETLRQLVHAILAHQYGQLQDDATAVLVEWRSEGPERLRV
jgi:serine phosphatase RsbU (regulator of sigma subunit)